MKKVFITLLLTLVFQGFVYSQNFRTHKVKQGETVEAIARQYRVTAKDIFALNPDAGKTLAVGTVLIIPDAKGGSGEKTETREFMGYQSHKVKRKETLYSISKQYNVEISDIKEHNKQLYSENLKKGDKIRIPKYKTIVQNVSVKENVLKKYKVQPKEGKWRIAYKFGITVPELEALNPGMNAILQPGDEINVPNIESHEEQTADGDHGYYVVQPKEGFYRLKVKLGLSQEQLETLNPGLSESGLKEGMVLKVPKSVKVDGVQGEIIKSNLSETIKNFSTKRLAMFLPFKLDKIDTDSVQEAKDIMKNDRLVSVTLDFYSGVKLALDSASQMGISVDLKVFDTQNQPSEVSTLLSNNNFSRYDAVIGPVIAGNFARVASQLRKDNVPIISPLMKPTTLYENVFQTIPSDEYLERAMINFVKTDSLRSNVVIISDWATKDTSDRIKSEIPMASQVSSQKGSSGKDAFYVDTAKLSSLLKNGKNYVFIETGNAGLVLNVVSTLNSLNSREKEIILVTTRRTDAFDYEHISNFHLSNLKFHYPSVNKPFDSDNPNDFVINYRKIYGVDPNKYATRGYDLTLDVLLRLASADDFYKSCANDIETEYVENKFRYAKQLTGGYYNESVYILKYTPNLTIEAVKR